MGVFEKCKHIFTKYIFFGTIETVLIKKIVRSLDSFIHRIWLFSVVDLYKKNLLKKQKRTKDFYDSAFTIYALTSYDIFSTLKVRYREKPYFVP